MRRISISTAAITGIVAGILTGWIWPAKISAPDPDYRAGQAESATKARALRVRLRAERPQGKSPEAAAAFIRKIKNEPIETGTLRYSSGRPDFAIDTYGQLNVEGLKAMKIPLSSKPRLQKIIDAAISQASADMLTRARSDPRRSDDGRGIRAYRIPADADASKDYLDQAERDFATTVSNEQAARLRQNMSNLLDSFGRRDLRILIRPDAVSGDLQAKFQYIDPLTGFEAGGSYAGFIGRPDHANPLGRLAGKILQRDQ